MATVHFRPKPIAGLRSVCGRRHQATLVYDFTSDDKSVE